MRGALPLADLLRLGVPGQQPASYATTSVHSTFELMVHAPGGSLAPLILLKSLFSDTLGLPQEVHLDISRPREWEADGRYRALFTAFEIRPQDILLR